MSQSGHPVDGQQTVGQQSETQRFETQQSGSQQSGSQPMFGRHTGRISTPQDLRDLTGADFLVSEQQWAAISADPAPGVVIAGAGSGKTELMSARVIYLVANGLVRPDQVLGLTFTTKATAELSERVRKALARAGLDRIVPDPDGIGEDGQPGERLEPTISTYNAYAAHLLTEHGLRIGHEQDLRLMGDAARFQLAQRVVSTHEDAIVALSDHPATVISYLLALDGAMSEHLVTPEQVRAFHAHERPEFAASLARQQMLARTVTKVKALAGVMSRIDQREELLDLVVRYRRLKQSYGVMDFSDQIAGAHRLATEHPEVGAAERDKYRVVLLDEYQDTSVAQARLLAGLFSGPTPQTGRGHAVMAVGDPNQAIYGWRGASVANIQQFRQQFPTASGGWAQHFSLTVNRRSDASILALANELARPLLEEPGTLVAPLEAKPDAAPGLIRAALHATDTDEVNWLADQVLAAHAAGTPWSEIGVLVRTNKHGAEAYDVLTAADIPVEIVGLAGLIRLPEVAQVVATLSLLEDVTDNASLLTLLAGPRWQIGVRDLALLGERSAELARVDSGGRAAGDRSVAEELSDSVAGVDPTELSSLNEALESPGEGPYSPEALVRFARLADELRYLRGFIGEPLLDLLRRIMDVSGLDIELASSGLTAAEARRENLDLFVKAVADFQAVDGAVTLTALNAWLATEDEEGGGLDLAPPSESDTVKLLTIHRAKGLEYDVVFCIGMAAGKFPNTVLRPQWTTGSYVLPAPLRGDAASIPQLQGYEPADLSSAFVASDDPDHALDTRARAHQEMEERRLGYVAFTRARHEFVVSSHVWGSTIKPREASPYLALAHDFVVASGRQADVWYSPDPQETNPRIENPPRAAWPPTDHDAERQVRQAGAALVAAADPAAPDLDLNEVEAARVARWDAEIDKLLEEARAGRGEEILVPVPASLSASDLMDMRRNPHGFAERLLRPMPRPPSSAARFGTAFHAWIEARAGQQQLLDLDDLPGRADEGIEDVGDLAHLQERFENGPFAERQPYVLEAPFAFALDGHVVRGRIDAVFTEPDGSWLVVDWKTNVRENADPFQLAIYAHAWADLMDVPIDRVAAEFYYVRTGVRRRLDPLPTRADVVAAFSPAAVADPAPRQVLDQDPVLDVSVPAAPDQPKHRKPQQPVRSPHREPPTPDQATLF